MILYGTAQLVGAAQQKNRRKAASQRQRPAPPDPLSGDARLGRPATPTEDSLRREVQDFLRRAQGQNASAPANRDAAKRAAMARSAQTELRRPDRAVLQRAEVQRAAA